MFRKLKESLPGFSMDNWTSCLRHYAGFPNCEEGPSDFVYKGDMSAIQKLFKLTENGNWKTVYIEVKATSRSSKDYFHLSASQFERVRAI